MGPVQKNQSTSVAAVAPVKLGKHVIVGSGSVVLPGAELGEGVAVGAISFVSRSLEPWDLFR